MYNDITLNRNIIRNDYQIIHHFVDGAFVEIKSPLDRKFKVEFWNKNNVCEYSTTLNSNSWAKTNKKYFEEYTLKVYDETDKIVFDKKYDATGKRVFIALDSKALGDTLAWFPYVEEFRKKWNCKVLVSTFFNYLFEDVYPEIEFVNPGVVVNNLYAMYKIGWYTINNTYNENFNKNDFKKIPLQQTASDILGLNYTEIKPKTIKLSEYKFDKPYICIAIHSTAQSKYWNNPTGWQELVDYVKSNGYDVYLLSKEEDGYMGNKHPDGVIKIKDKTLEEVGSILKGSIGFVGIGSGLSWFSWTLNVPTILISGFSDPIQEMQKDVIRIINKNVCNGCFFKHTFDPGDWNWCPEHKGSQRQFECTKSITFDMVKPHLDNFFEKISR